MFAFVLPLFLLPAQSTSVCVRFCLFVCVRVCPHVLYALSACSQLIKTHCRLSCFPPACLPGGCSSTHQTPSTLLSCSPLTSPHLPSPPSPSLHCYPTPIISLLFAHDTSLLLHPHGTFLHSLVLLISKLKTSHCQVGSDCHMLC